MCVCVCVCVCKILFVQNPFSACYLLTIIMKFHNFPRPWPEMPFSPNCPGLVKKAPQPFQIFKDHRNLVITTALFSITCSKGAEVLRQLTPVKETRAVKEFITRHNKTKTHTCTQFSEAHLFSNLLFTTFSYVVF